MCTRCLLLPPGGCWGLSLHQLFPVSACSDNAGEAGFKTLTPPSPPFHSHDRSCASAVRAYRAVLSHKCMFGSFSFVILRFLLSGRLGGRFTPSQPESLKPHLHFQRCVDGNCERLLAFS